jgi:hypothetical protein
MVTPHAKTFTYELVPETLGPVDGLALRRVPGQVTPEVTRMDSPVVGQTRLLGLEVVEEIFLPTPLDDP